MAKPNATAAAPAAASTALQFEDVAIPKTTRSSAPNPFLVVVGTLVGTSRALALRIDTPDDKALGKTLRLLAIAGDAQEPQVSVRKRVEASEDGKTALVTFWVTDRIIHAPHAPRGTAATA